MSPFKVQFFWDRHYDIGTCHELPWVRTCWQNMPTGPCVSPWLRYSKRFGMVHIDYETQKRRPLGWGRWWDVPNLIEGDSSNRWSCIKYHVPVSAELDYCFWWQFFLGGWTLLKPYERTASPGPWRSLPSCLRRWPKPTPWSCRKRSWKPPTLWWLRKVQVERPLRMHHLVKRRLRMHHLQSDGCEPTKIVWVFSPMTRMAWHERTWLSQKVLRSSWALRMATGSSLTKSIDAFGQGNHLVWI